MSVIRISAFIAAMAASVAHAADCKAISDPAARLACFDALSTSTASKPKNAALDDIEKAKRAIAATLKDPYSAQFGEVFRGAGVPGKPIICGSVNAKNMYGGYVGLKPFFYLPSSEVAVLLADGSAFPVSALDVYRIGCQGDKRALAPIIHAR
ncbi:hypothetical protein [Bradyrhizobium sp. NP1]|uniref:hypothetical protein n=1 Tax=Bradyrhizobium sp. NP1 TaxID=3049772 RepID=UPI0025A62F6C|nr:hypothetical protein [Bradyrhizobium sp. NP1]WJR74941.1 hypothetical protein QOU61_19120 [Bradyrhizobium sp. NP1]